MPAQPEAYSDGYVPFLARFAAWWHGVAPTDFEELAPADPAAAETRIEVSARPQQRWPAQRMEICRRLWGEGFILAGGSDHMVNFAKPLCLDPAMSVLDIAAGPGGGPLAISQNSKVWITALESDPELVTQASELCARKGGSRVEIVAWDPAAPNLPVSKYDCIYGREVIYRVADKPLFLAAIQSAMKPGGQLLFSDFIFAEDGVERAPFKAWQRAETGNPRPWSIAEYRRVLKEHKLQIRVCSNDTDGLKHLILRGWADFVDGLQRSDLTRDFVDHMMLEAELWLARVRALEDGQLQVARIHALKPHQVA